MSLTSTTRAFKVSSKHGQVHGHEHLYLRIRMYKIFLECPKHYGIIGRLYLQRNFDIHGPPRPEAVAGAL